MDPHPDDVGFVFEALWRKRKFDAVGRRIPAHSCPDVRIPDTVLYKSGYPAQWYFQVGGLLESAWIPLKNHADVTRFRDRLNAYSAASQSGRTLRCVSSLTVETRSGQDPEKEHAVATDSEDL